MGRPKSKNPKNKGIRIRLTEEEYRAIRALAEASGVSMTDLFMEGMSRIFPAKTLDLYDEIHEKYPDRKFVFPVNMFRFVEDIVKERNNDGK